MKIDTCKELLEGVPADKQLPHLADVLLRLVKKVGEAYVIPARYGACLMRLKHVLMQVYKSTFDPMDLAMSNVGIRCEELFCYVPPSIYEFLVYAYSRL